MGKTGQKVPQFSPSLYKSKKQFGHSFAFDATTIGNKLVDEGCSSLSPLTERNLSHICSQRLFHHSFFQPLSLV